jgi:hypothetical protein
MRLTPLLAVLGWSAVSPLPTFPSLLAAQPPPHNPARRVDAGSQAHKPILAKQSLLARHTWWDNRDWDWYKARIPFFESPDTAIDATYYYRWELVTKHLTYGSPETGYTFTEFIDRPFWSGVYGAISCPLGHQFYELRWLKDRRVVDDFARYWFQAPGAQPRSYSNWYGDAMWARYLVTRDENFLRTVLPYMERQYEGWLAEHFDSAHRMFRWDGLHDGMEESINSRQTDDPEAGAEGYRPTLNSYMYADALAISRAATLFADTAKARRYAKRAADLKGRVQEELWDPRRQFFLHQFARDERDGIKAKTRTYETGKYAGNPHGRELLGYVPWQFNLPDPGYEVAWRYLMDTAYFFAPYGPTTTERHDPLFLISPRCCFWSGNSWPYATTQTLVAMANLLNNYRQSVVTKRDYLALFQTYTRTQRKDGRPYVAEAANPDNASWEGHDTYYHSEHYFHSGYADLVITGLVGLRPRADDSLEVNPLAPDDWPYFALDDVAYHGYRVSVIWDRDGTRYRRGRGLTVFADGRPIATARRLGRLVAHLGPARVSADTGADGRRDQLRNLAINNGRGAYPWVTASFSAPETPPFYLVDGNYWYHRSPPNRWTAAGSRNARDWVVLNFGTARPVEELKLYFLDDGAGIRPPARYDVEVWDGRAWVAVPAARRTPLRPVGRRPNVVSFRRPVETSKVRVVFTHRPGSSTGLTELEAWTRATLPLPEPTAPSSNAAYNASGQGFPKATASYTSPRDRVEEVNDMRVAFTRYSRNRWTARGSPNASDWVEIDFGEPKAVRAVELYLWGDGGDVRAPRLYTVQYWDGGRWADARMRSQAPARPAVWAVNTVRVEPVRTDKIRVVLEHDLPSVSGVTELMVWQEAP